MFSNLFNWRSALAIVAIAIVTGTIFYSQYISKKIAADERKKVNVWVQSLKTRATTSDESALALTNTITSENTDIPIIETDEKDNPCEKCEEYFLSVVKNCPKLHSNPYFSIHACGTVPKLSSQSLNRLSVHPRPVTRRVCSRSFSRRPSQ